MAITSHVYQIYIAATPQQVWTAITDSDWTTRYFHGTAFAEPLQQGRPYRMLSGGERPAVEGEIEEMVPPTEGAPGRLVQTWRVLYDAAMSQEPPSRVEWTVAAAGEGLTRVRLVHGGLAFSPLTWAAVKDGWVWVLDGMKTVLETGRELPAADDVPESTETATATATATATDGDWHRRQGVEANNEVWQLAAKPDRSPDDDEEMLRRAYTAAYHWQRATGAGPQNEARASYMIAKALLLSGQAEASLRSADRCLEVCTRHGLGDFDLAYAHEARARALSALGRTDESAREWDAAVAVPIADPEDREIIDNDFADRPTVAVT